ncbi:MAG: 23S rRNA (guanosine(2251)-2'-O)-methyltransferase RlmB [Bacillus subtilis]|nr:23S rRNA (guanosine(2251)-2'-O)-methyltransferase RlmB [Bacillus subtilis]
MAIQVFGKNPAKEYLSTGKPIIKAYLLENNHADIVDQLKRREIVLEVLGKPAMDRKFAFIHQGVVFDTPDFPTIALEDALRKYQSRVHPLLVLLDGIEDPHNLGAIIRTAEAAGAQAIVIPKNRAAGITGTVVKVSTGAIEHIDIVEVVNLNQTIEKLKKQGYWIVGTTLEAKQPYTEINIDTPLAIVIGNEGKGMSRLVRETVDYNVTIPMAGTTNSLNASVSAGVILFDILRRRTTPKQ